MSRELDESSSSFFFVILAPRILENTCKGCIYSLCYCYALAILYMFFYQHIDKKSKEEDKKNVAQNVYSCMSQIVALVPSRQEKWTSLVSSVTDYHWNFIWLYLICYCSVLQYLEVVMRCGYYCYFFFCFSWHWCGFDVWFLRPFNSLLEISVSLSTPASRRSLKHIKSHWSDSTWAAHKSSEMFWHSWWGEAN